MTRDNCCGDRMYGNFVTVGTNSDPRNNTKCKDLWTMNEGGWYSCNPVLSGNVFGICARNVGNVDHYSYVNFLEAMVYT